MDKRKFIYDEVIYLIKDYMMWLKYLCFRFFLYDVEKKVGRLCKERNRGVEERRRKGKLIRIKTVSIYGGFNYNVKDY